MHIVTQTLETVFLVNSKDIEIEDSDEMDITQVKFILFISLSV